MTPETFVRALAKAGTLKDLGLKLRQVAERLGISVNAVKVQLHRASGRLRSEL